MLSIFERPGVRAGAAGWVARHRFAGPVGWGLASGFTAGPLIFGSVFPGYILGLAGGGAALVWLSIGSMAAGFALIFVSAILSSTAACPSCVDAIIAVPPTFLFLLVPYAVGYQLGRRKYRQWQASPGVPGRPASGPYVPAALLSAVLIIAIGVVAWTVIAPGTDRALVLLVGAIPSVWVGGRVFGLRGSGDWIAAAVLATVISLLVAWLVGWAAAMAFHG